MYQGNTAGAKVLARRAAELDPSYFFPVMVEGWAELEAGQFRNAIPALKKAKGMDAPPFVTAYLAFAYGAAGDRAGALDGLEQAYAANSQMMPWIGRDAMFDPLRSEPRFAALLKQVHLAR
jgi:predicted Zn-dependent protease